MLKKANKEKTKTYKELLSRLERERKINKLRLDFELQKNLMGKERKKKLKKQQKKNGGNNNQQKAYKWFNERKK